MGMFDTFAKIGKGFNKSVKETWTSLSSKLPLPKLTAPVGKTVNSMLTKSQQVLAPLHSRVEQGFKNIAAGTAKVAKVTAGVVSQAVKEVPKIASVLQPLVSQVVSVGSNLVGSMGKLLTSRLGAMTGLIGSLQRPVR